MPYRLQDDAVNSTASSISAMFYTIKTPEAKNKYDRVKMTSCINVYTFLYTYTFMCVQVYVYMCLIYRQSTYMNHDYLVLGLRYIYIYKFARASICMKAPLQAGQHVYRRMSLVFCTNFANTVAYIVLCSHCTFCSLGIAVVTYT